MALKTGGVTQEESEGKNGSRLVVPCSVDILSYYPAHL